MGLQGKHLGLWNYTLFEIGITEISFEIGIKDLKSNQRMMGTFNQHLPMILSNNYCSQRDHPEALYKQAKVALDSWDFPSM